MATGFDLSLGCSPTRRTVAASWRNDERLSFGCVVDVSVARPQPPTWHPGDVTARVLVVEDDDSVRGAVTLVLERSGFDVTAVGDGHSAIAEASRSGAQSNSAVHSKNVRAPSVTGVSRSVAT